MPETKTHGTAVLTCRNHPTYRWTHVKFVLSGVSPYIGQGKLMFDGEEGGKPANPIQVLSERRLAKRSQEFQEHYREHYTPECDCSLSDLQFLKWSDD